MRKVWPLPKFDEKLLKRLDAADLKLVRKSKECITLLQAAHGDENAISQMYARHYAFHIDIDKKEVKGFNLNEYTSSYKRATIWLKREELLILLAVEEELNRLLAANLISPVAEAENNKADS